VIPLLVVGTVLIGYAALSGLLDRRGVTSAMAFVVAGLVVGTAGFGWLDVSVESTVAERVTELALVFLLFSDSARIDLRGLRRSLGWPSRLLLVGLPLTIATGLGAGLLVFPGMAVTSAFLLSTMLCSTDAALGQRVVDDPAVPARVRQALDVESGLNDGVAVPFFLVAVDLSTAALVGGVPSAVIGNIASQIGWGVVAGVGAGVVGGCLLRAAEERGWLQAQWRQAFTLAVALSAYAAAGSLGGSGFIAAFVGGMVFGGVSRQHGLGTTYLAEEVGSILAAVTWMGFGALAISAAWPDITWRVVLYALLSLTVVRMLPVAVALAGTGAGRQTLAFMGWFGPRGLASIVFGLLALERSVPDSHTLLATVVVTVGLSVFVHGLTAKPFVAAYHRWYSDRTAAAASVPEAEPTRMPRRRRQPGADDVSWQAVPDAPTTP
jgi:NhaP-type Na+/H+ or K+/H+ antiporter